jgi:glycosyltransferase involved in cell wall biosynthesis
VIELLARGLNGEKYELHLGTLTSTPRNAEPLPATLREHFINVPRVRRGAFRLLRLVRELKPDLILSGMFHLNFLVLLLRPIFPCGTRVLVRQNGTVSAALAFGCQPWYTRLLYRFLYRNADRVICQTRSMAGDLAMELGLHEDRIVVLPNPVDVDQIRNFVSVGAESKPGAGPHLLAVGRLSQEKGFDLLLQALALVRRQYPDARLSIAGAGPEEAALKAECRDLGLDSVVNFRGPIARPWTLFADATLFVLSSRHEGLPNALLEAATGGLPIVALPSSGGVVELLSGQPGVWLAKEISVEALAASLLLALESLRPGERFDHAFVDEFRIYHAIEAYENLIDETLEENCR